MFIVIGTIGAVSAIDTNDTVVSEVSLDDTDVDEITEEISVKDGFSDWNELKTALEADTEDTLYLDGKTYSVDSVASIFTAKTVIGGSQANPNAVATLDGLGESQFFNYYPVKITFKNVIFKNGNGGSAAPISAFSNINGVNFEFIGCTFIGNKGVNGGVLRVTGAKSTVNIVNCSFIGNSATKGGAVYSESKLTIDNCIFENNSATNGDAIYVTNQLTLSNSTFKSTKASSTDATISIKSTVNGEINLVNNKIQTANLPIYNDGGKFTTPLKLNFVNAEVKTKEEVVLKAILTDNDGNAIGLPATIAGTVNGANVVYAFNKTAQAFTYAYTAPEVTTNTTYVLSGSYGDAAVTDGALKITVATPQPPEPPVKKDIPDSNIKIENIKAVTNDYIGKVTIPSDATGSVDVYVNNVKYTTADLINGEASWYIKNLTAGSYNIAIKYSGDDQYNNFTKTSSLVLAKKDIPMSDIKIETSVPKVTNVTEKLTIPSDATGSVDVYVDKVKYVTVNLVNGVASWNFNNLTVGNRNITIKYSGDDKYNSFTMPTNVILVKSDIPFDDRNVSIGQTLSTDFEGTMTLPSDVTGNVTVSVNGTVYKVVPLVAGKASWKLVGVPAGADKVTIEYSGDVNYNGFTKTVDVNITKKEGSTAIIAQDVVKYFQNNTQLVFKLVDENGTPLVGEKIQVNINGESYNRTTKDNGTATFPINLPAGEYTVELIYKGNGSHLASNITVNVKVLPIIIASNLIKYFQNDSQFDMVLLNKDGSLGIGNKVELNINGQFYNRTANNESKATFKINLPAGDYKLTCFYQGTQIGFNVTVLPLVIMKNTELYFQNGTAFVMHVVDKQGNIAAGAKLRLNINGQFYNRTVNGSGDAKVDIKLPVGKYIVTVYYDDAGFVDSRNVTVLPNAVTSDLEMTNKNRKSFTVKVLDKQGNVANGVNLRFNVNGIFYERKNVNGTASLNMNLPVGEYIITTIYDDLMISNTIKIKP